MPKHVTVPTKVSEDIAARRERAADALKPPEKRLFVPPLVARELAEEARDKFRADIMVSSYRDDVCATWDRELRRLDPLLSMRRAHENVVAGLPLEPGRYHVLRDNPGAPMSVIVVRGPNGELEPPGRLLDQLLSQDLQNPSVTRMHQKIKEATERAAQRESDLRREQRDEHTLERWMALSRTQVSMNPDVPWSQNASPAARRDARTRKKKDDPSAS